MTTPILPQPIAAYFLAEQQNCESIVRCFTVQAAVKDEGRTYVGIAAIRAWKMACSSKYSYTTEPLALTVKGGRYLVTSRVTGSFPGSPVDLRYEFRLERGLIASLEITV